MTICNAQPTEAYVLIAGNAPGERIGLVVRGERGYNKLDFDNPTLDVNAVKELVLRLNNKLGITPHQAECMLIGSMFGWDAPGADPTKSDFTGIMHPDPDDGHQKESSIKMGVLAENSYGAPEIYTCTVVVSRREFDAGEHYDMAKEDARKHGYNEPMMAFCESDPAARLLVKDAKFFHGEATQLPVSPGDLADRLSAVGEALDMARAAIDDASSVVDAGEGEDRSYEKALAAVAEASRMIGEMAQEVSPRAARRPAAR
ncbi:MAG: hypothetical protein BroJett021_33820 [Chloroflexota bacterium]|nr:MAG: hypothetical protein BroJett021_33820 [Chloroflexota bacterium]